MLKHGDRAFEQLAAHLQEVASSRYAEVPEAVFLAKFMKNESTGVRFEELKPGDQLDMLNDSVPWHYYEEEGLSNAQAAVIFSNVRAGKPQENWLEGICDEAVLENERIVGFKALVESMRNSPDNHYFEEMDGSRQEWANLSAAAKLQYIASDAAYYGVPFEPFAEMVTDTIGDIGDAALRVVLDSKKELHELAKLLPDDGRLEPTPLVERLKDILYPESEKTSPVDDKPITLQDLAALVEEMRADEAAAKQEPGHWYGKSALEKMLEGKTKAPSAEKVKDRDIER